MVKGKHVTAQEEETIDKMRKEGKTLKHIAIEMNRSLVTVAKHSRIKYVHNRWSDSDKQMAHELLRKGYSHQEMAIEMKRSKASVRQFFYYERQKGIMTLRGCRELWEDGNGGKKKGPKPYVPRPWGWRQEETFKALQLQAMGYNNHEIAEKLNRSHSAVCRALRNARRGVANAY